MCRSRTPEGGADDAGEVHERGAVRVDVIEISSVYYRAYKLAYDSGERQSAATSTNSADDTFLGFGYRDSLKKGLSPPKSCSTTSGGWRCGTSRDRREYELTKHVSLRQLDPLALVRFICRNSTTVKRDATIPQALFDAVHLPGRFQIFTSNWWTCVLWRHLG